MKIILFILLLLVVAVVAEAQSDMKDQIEKEDTTFDENPLEFDSLRKGSDVKVNESFLQFNKRNFSMPIVVPNIGLQAPMPNMHIELHPFNMPTGKRRRSLKLFYDQLPKRIQEDE